MGSGLVAITVHSVWGEISPAQARARGMALHTLNATQGRTLETLGDVLLPGAREAGIAHYVDDQLRRDNPLFILKYMDYVGSYTAFYSEGLRSLERQSSIRYQRSFLAISREQQEELVRALSQNSPPGWNGPPAPLFYFVTRNDAIDVVYGTPEGFEKLNFPYMAHIRPPERW
jgi:hypothetical protein